MVDCRRGEDEGEWLRECGLEPGEGDLEYCCCMNGALGGSNGIFQTGITGMGGTGATGVTGTNAGI